MSATPRRPHRYEVCSFRNKQTKWVGGEKEDHTRVAVNIELIINICASSEQHAADELLQLAVKGGDIDGQVLAYLEVAQVRPDTDL